MPGMERNRKLIRLKGYDYSKEGLYFITICVKNRECLFGKIEGNIIIRIWGGKVRIETLIVRGEPEFSTNEDVILFLYKLDVRQGEVEEGYSHEAVFGVTGNIQGKGTVKDDNYVDRNGNVVSLNNLINQITKRK